MCPWPVLEDTRIIGKKKELGQLLRPRTERIVRVVVLGQHAVYLPHDLHAALPFLEVSEVLCRRERTFATGVHVPWKLAVRAQHEFTEISRNQLNVHWLAKKAWPPSEGTRGKYVVPYSILYQKKRGGDSKPASFR